MKFLAVILTVFSLALVEVSSQRRSLAYVINDIVSLIPKQKIEAITAKELQTNAGLQRIFEYLNSNEWKETLATASNHPRWQYIQRYLDDERVDWRKYVAWFEKLLATKYTHKLPGITSIHNYVKAVEKSIPVAKIAAKAILYKFSSKSFNKFEKIIGDNETRKLANYFRRLPGTVKLDMLLKKAGFDWNVVIWNPIYKYFRWPQLN